jgi:hypothetical protein
MRSLYTTHAHIILAYQNGVAAACFVLCMPFTDVEGWCLFQHTTVGCHFENIASCVMLAFVFNSDLLNNMCCDGVVLLLIH